MRVALFLFALSLYLLSMTGTLGIDEETMYLVTESIAERGTFAVGPSMLRETWTKTGRNGREYSYIEMGQSVLALPFYYMGRAVRRFAPESLHSYVTRAAVAALGPFAGASAVVLVSLLVEALGHPPKVGATVALFAGLGTLLWPYARTFYREPVLAALLLAVVWAIVRHRGGGALGWAWLAGIAFFAACTVRVLLLGLTPFFLAPLLRSPRRGAWAVFASFALLALGADLGYNALRFGSCFNTGYSEEETFSHPLLVGLYGFLLSPGRGIFYFCPVLLLSLCGVARMWRGQREALGLIGAVCGFHLCLYACWWAWADHRGLWGARYLMPMLPLALVPAAWVRPSKGWLALLLGLSVAIQTMGVLTWGRFLCNPEKEGANVETKAFDPSYSPILNLDGWKSIGCLRWDRAYTPQVLRDPHSDTAHELRDTTAATWWAIAWRAGLPRRMFLPAFALVALFLSSGAVLAWRCR